MTTLSIPSDDTHEKLSNDVAGILTRLGAETSPLALLLATVVTTLSTIANDMTGMF